MFFCKKVQYWLIFLVESIRDWKCLFVFSFWVTVSLKMSSLDNFPSTVVDTFASASSHGEVLFSDSCTGTLRDRLRGCLSLPVYMKLGTTIIKVLPWYGFLGWCQSWNPFPWLAPVPDFSLTIFGFSYLIALAIFAHTRAHVISFQWLSVLNIILHGHDD